MASHVHNYMPQITNSITIYIVLSPTLTAWTVLAYLRCHELLGNLQGPILTALDSISLRVCLCIPLGCCAAYSVLPHLQGREKAKYLAFYTGLLRYTTSSGRCSTLAVLDSDIPWTWRTSYWQWLVVGIYWYCYTECILLVGLDALDSYKVSTFTL